VNRFWSFRLRRRIKIPPPGVLVLLYGLAIACGAALLKLPIAANVRLSWADAMFTATSAVTVTGLSVVDIGSELTLFGQIIVALLIQIGGIGIMTFAVLILSLLGQSIQFPHRLFLRDDLNQTSFDDLGNLVWIILRVVLVCELAGTVVLAFVFVPDFGWWPGLWQALFTAISAFNNAGFALFADSLAAWATDPLVNIAVPTLFIVGGLGFSVLCDVQQSRRWHQFSLHTKLMLTGTALLSLLSIVGFAALEWTNPLTLGGIDTVEGKLAVSWFQAMTTRTAGFSTIDIAGIHDSTALMTISLMLVGGGSTSTAGGIKVTTFVVLLLATAAFFQRRDELSAFGRSLGHQEVLKVLALTMLSLLVVMTGLFLVTIAHDGDFMDLAFEVASAFGTVGLSRGVTGDLDGFSLSIIALIMFIGRVGPLLLGFFLAIRVSPRIRYPSGEVFLG